MVYLVSKQFHLYNSNNYEPLSLKESIEILSDKPVLSLDTETQGLDVFTKKLLLLQIGTFEIQILFDIASYEGKVPEELAIFLNNSDALFLLQFAKFDLKFLIHQGIIIKKIYDTFLAESIITHGLQYGERDLESLAMKYCSVQLDKSIRGEIIKKGLTDRVLDYGAKDIKYLEKIKDAQQVQIEKLNLQRAVDLDNAFTLVLAYIEYCGIKLDYEKWKKKTDKNVQESLELSEKLSDMLWNDGKREWFSGMINMFTLKQECTINWDSPQQVLKLFQSYGINTTLKVKGQDVQTTDIKVLAPQQDKFPILSIYIPYKEKRKEITTYGYDWRKQINSVTGRIHTTYKQLVDTGRLSSGNKKDGTKNLQNIPSDVETRSCFVSEKGCDMTSADYSSQEQIILANASKEENLISFYKRGFTDMHSYVAFLMYPGIRRFSIDELTPENIKYIKIEYPKKREIAKRGGFAINYGGNGATIAKNCNISRADGEYAYKAYFEAFPQMKLYFDKCFQLASHFKYIQFNSVTKRKYFFNPEENNYFKYQEEMEDPYFWATNPNARSISAKFREAKSEIQRISQNYPIQGTGADITKYASILFFSEILKRNWLFKVKIINLIHDEILTEQPSELTELVNTVLIHCMEQAGKPFCTILPLKASAKSGKHWIH